MSKGDLSEIKALKKPPPPIRMLMEAKLSDSLQLRLSQLPHMISFLSSSLANRTRLRNSASHCSFSRLAQSTPWPGGVLPAFPHTASEALGRAMRSFAALSFNRSAIEMCRHSCTSHCCVFAPL